jgi:hypothetical protein
MTEKSEDAARWLYVLRAPLFASRTIGVGALPEIEIDSVRHDVRLRPRVECGDLRRLRTRDRADRVRAAQCVVENRASPRIEQSDIQLVAADQRHEGSSHPHREHRRCEQWQSSAERDHVRHGVEIDALLDAVPEQIDRVRGIGVDRHASERAIRRLLIRRGGALPIDVDHIDGDARTHQSAHDAIARLTHSAAIGRVVLGDEEQAHGR